MRRHVLLGALIATLAVVVPDAGTASTDAVLVDVQRADGVAVGDDDVVWVLAVGSDARPGEDMTRVNGDALQLVGMDTSTGAATSIGIPRDSYVAVPGHGSERVNNALHLGGPQLLSETVADFVGIQPDYVFVTRFPFFEQMVDDIGGISVENPRAFSDDNLKPEGFEAGRIRLDGYGAMAFSRVRKELPGGDFDRSANQQRVLRGIQRRVAEQADRRGFLESGVLTVLEHTDTDLSPAELFRLARAVAEVDPRRITGCVVQGTPTTTSFGASVVLPAADDARRYGDDARDDAVISRC